MIWDFPTMDSVKPKWRSKWRKPVKDYGRRYNVSFFGEVFSKPKKRGPNAKNGDSQGQYLKKSVHNGYYAVILYRKEGDKTTPKRHYVHRLVAEAFVPNPFGYRFVHHIDGNKQNNHVHNLVWISQSILKRKLAGDCEEIPEAFMNFYRKVMRFHGYHIQKLHREGESVESLAVRYRVAEVWIQRILENKRLKPKIIDAEARRKAQDKKWDDAFDRWLFRMEAESKRSEERFQQREKQWDVWASSPH